MAFTLRAFHMQKSCRRIKNNQVLILSSDDDEGRIFSAFSLDLDRAVDA